MSYEEALRRIEEAAETGEPKLNLMYYGLRMLPPQVCQLTKLTNLWLKGNKLTSLPLKIFQLKNLKSLDLRDNQLTMLPSKIVQLPKLTHLYLDNNPLISPSPEIAEQGIDAIREYFAALEGEERLLNEVKIILVGDGASGKTSLSRCFMGGRFNPTEETTHGIRLKNWQVEAPDRQLRCNLWDFGGQEIMHATHQFFLSRRSLYVLVLDGRRDERPEYWLRLIETFGGDSPILVVLNKYDTNPGFNLNRPELERKFPGIRGFWRTSCATGQYIDNFKEALVRELAMVPLIKTRWANSWFAVKQFLENLEDPCISYRRFEHICTDAGVIKKSSRDVLLEFLHDLGIVIHFKEFELEDAHVLDPEWVTEAVYKIINDPLISEQKGELNRSDLREILQRRKNDRYVYEWKDYIYLLGLMKKFELCYELDDERVLIPQLLNVPEPEFAFAEDNALRFLLRYEDFLPPAVMPSFIVRRHREIKGDLRWRTGVVLENPLLEAIAVVRADNETRRIHITVGGIQRKAYLSVIMLSLREINADFRKLKVSERVPMPDDPERTADFETLLNYAEQGIKKYIPEGSKKAYSVRKLLDTVDEEKMLRLLADLPGDLPDQQSFAEELDRTIEIKPGMFGINVDIKELTKTAWKRYRAWRG